MAVPGSKLRVLCMVLRDGPGGQGGWQNDPQFSCSDSSAITCITNAAVFVLEGRPVTWFWYCFFCDGRNHLVLVFTSETAVVGALSMYPSPVSPCETFSLIIAHMYIRHAKTFGKKQPTLCFQSYKRLAHKDPKVIKKKSPVCLLA